MAGYDKFGGNMQQSQESNTSTTFSKETTKEVSEFRCKAIPSRGLLLEDAKLFGIVSSVSQEDGKTLTATYFPSYQKDGTLAGYAKRDWTKHKDEKFHFTAVGSVLEKNMLFNQQNVQKGGKRLYIGEGPEEAVAIYRCLVDSIKGTKWEGKLPPPNVVALPLGTAAAAACIAHNLEFVQSFGEIVLAFDSDEATVLEKRKNLIKGKEAREEVANLLLADNIFTITHPAGMKDSRECLLEGKQKELAQVLSFGLEKYSPENIVSGDDSDLEDLLTPLKEGHYIDRYPKLCEKIHGFRAGNELITYTAFSGVGKSTLNREIAWELVNAGYKCGFIFLEEPLRKTQQALLSLELGVNLSEFRQDPLKVATREAIAEAKNKVLSNGRTFFLDHFGSLKVSKLMQQIKYLHHICGNDHIFIDHISMVVAGSESNNERKDIDMLYEELASFMSVNPVTIHAVCHLKRVEDQQPKLKEGEEPQPYWRTVKKEMLRGSSGIEAMSSCIIALENEVLPDETRGRVRTKVLKDREWGVLGVCDVLKQGEDGRLYSAEDSSPSKDFSDF